MQGSLAKQNIHEQKKGMKDGRMKMATKRNSVEIMLLYKLRKTSLKTTLP
jgi:hypothetical protein